MTTTAPIPTSTVDRFVDAEIAWKAATMPSTGDSVDLLEFVGRLDFLVTIGHLTKEQANALIHWFQTEGVDPLPELPKPPSVTGMSLYEILLTADKVVRDHQEAAGVDSIFGDILGVFTGPIDVLLHTAGEVLHEGTLLVGAATEFVHTLSEL